MIISLLPSHGNKVFTYEKALGMAKVNQICSWLNTYVGEEDEEWGWISYTIVIKFKRPEDESVFRLLFGLS